MLINRRQVLLTAGATAATGMGLGTYAFAVEPGMRLAVTHYAPAPPQWPATLPLRIAVLADIHAIAPWMSLERIQAIVSRTNALAPDIVLLAGDYEASLRDFGLGKPVSMAECAAVLAGLRAPLGVHAVLGNHDVLVERGDNVRRAFSDAGLPVMENDALRISHGGQPFWLLGLGDQWGYGGLHRGHQGLDDLPGTLAKITDDAPAILLAHEPDIFPTVPDRVALTLAGHTHGGQVRVPFYGALTVPSRYGMRYAYGHIEEAGRHMIVSAGLGTTGLPVRFCCPPEIVIVDLGMVGDARVT